MPERQRMELYPLFDFFWSRRSRKLATPSKDTLLPLVQAVDPNVQYPRGCYNLLIQGHDGVFGRLCQSTVDAIDWKSYPQCWEIDNEKRTVRLLGESSDKRMLNLDHTIREERKRGNLKKPPRRLKESHRPVFSKGMKVALSIERLAAYHFGVVTYSVQLIVWGRHPSYGHFVLLSERAATNKSFPGMVDNTATGFPRTGEGSLQCLRRICKKRGLLTACSNIKNAKLAGQISYLDLVQSKDLYLTEEGLIMPQLQHIFELEINPEFKMRSLENVWHATYPKVHAMLKEGRFAPRSACVMLDFLMRVGTVKSDNEPNFDKIQKRLHRQVLFR